MRTICRIIIFWEVLFKQWPLITSQQCYKTVKLSLEKDDFVQLRLHSDSFIDKSYLVEELVNDAQTTTIITRPKGWGKSVNARMIRKFHEIEIDEEGNPVLRENRQNHALFYGGTVDVGGGETKQLKPLKIASYNFSTYYFGQFPVIYLSLKGIEGGNYDEVKNAVKRRIVRLFQKHSYLKKYTEKDSQMLDAADKNELDLYFSDDQELIDLLGSLQFLSQLFYKHFDRRVYIIVEDYDSPIYNAYIRFGRENEQDFKLLLVFFGKLLGYAFADNNYLWKGLLTGVLRVEIHELNSTNVLQRTLLDAKFSEYFGFTGVEVDQLLTKKPTCSDPSQIKSWYNGYNLGQNILYNPYSLTQCTVHGGKLDNYWKDCGLKELVYNRKVSNEELEMIKNLLAKRNVIKEIRVRDYAEAIDTSLTSLTVFASYLNAVKVNNRSDDFHYHLMIPNHEIKELLYRISVRQ